MLGPGLLNEFDRLPEPREQCNHREAPEAFRFSMGGFDSLRFNGHGVSVTRGKAPSSYGVLEGVKTGVPTLMNPEYTSGTRVEEGDLVVHLPGRCDRILGKFVEVVT